MAVLDFKEIPEAHKATGQQDTFEVFASDVLEFLGFTVVVGPSRGADGGKDLIVEEKRSGTFHSTPFRYLVSCKHKAHSGASVGTDSEVNIVDRVKSNKCDGFIGFYSTIPSSSLTEKLRGLDIPHRILNAGDIERALLKELAGIQIARRYMPHSLTRFEREHPDPVPLYAAPVTLTCEICGRDLLSKLAPPLFVGGTVNFCITQSALDDGQYSAPEIVDIRWSCKLKCTRRLEERFKAEGLVEDGWDDVDELIHPHKYIYLLNEYIVDSNRMSENARRKLSFVLTSAFPFVCRQQTAEEKEHQEILRGFGEAY